MTRFRELRLQRGLSQEQLCREYNEKYNRKYTTAAMSLIEHDKRSPELGALLDFADFYGVSLDYLLGRDLAGKVSYEFSADNKSRSWQLSEQLRNIILGLYSIKVSCNTAAKRDIKQKNIPVENTVLSPTVYLNDTENVKRGDDAIDGERLVMTELNKLDSMGEEEGNIEMLRSLLKQSLILARRVEKRRKDWYKY